MGCVHGLNNTKHASELCYQLVNFQKKTEKHGPNSTHEVLK